MERIWKRSKATGDAEAKEGCVQTCRVEGSKCIHFLQCPTTNGASVTWGSNEQTPKSQYFIHSFIHPYFVHLSIETNKTTFQLDTPLDIS